MSLASRAAYRLGFRLERRSRHQAVVAALGTGVLAASAASIAGRLELVFAVLGSGLAVLTGYGKRISP